MPVLEITELNALAAVPEKSGVAQLVDLLLEGKQCGEQMLGRPSEASLDIMHHCSEVSLFIDHLHHRSFFLISDN